MIGESGRKKIREYIETFVSVHLFFFFESSFRV